MVVVESWTEHVDSGGPVASDIEGKRIRLKSKKGGKT